MGENASDKHLLMSEASSGRPRRLADLFRKSTEIEAAAATEAVKSRHKRKRSKSTKTRKASPKRVRRTNTREPTPPATLKRNAISDFKSTLGPDERSTLKTRSRSLGGSVVPSRSSCANASAAGVAVPTALYRGHSTPTAYAATSTSATSTSTMTSPTAPSTAPTTITTTTTTTAPTATAAAANAAEVKTRLRSLDFDSPVISGGSAGSTAVGTSPASSVAGAATARVPRSLFGALVDTVIVKQHRVIGNGKYIALRAHIISGGGSVSAAITQKTAYVVSGWKKEEELVAALKPLVAPPLRSVEITVDVIEGCVSFGEICTAKIVPPTWITDCWQRGSLTSLRRRGSGAAAESSSRGRGLGLARDDSGVSPVGGASGRVSGSGRVSASVSCGERGVYSSGRATPTVSVSSTPGTSGCFSVSTTPSFLPPSLPGVLTPHLLVGRNSQGDSDDESSLSNSLPASSSFEFGCGSATPPRVDGGGGGNGSNGGGGGGGGSLLDRPYSPRVLGRGTVSATGGVGVGAGVGVGVGVDLLSPLTTPTAVSTSTASFKSLVASTNTSTTASSASAVSAATTVTHMTTSTPSTTGAPTETAAAAVAAVAATATSTPAATAAATATAPTSAVAEDVSSVCSATYTAKTVGQATAAATAPTPHDRVVSKAVKAEPVNCTVAEQRGETAATTAPKVSGVGESASVNASASASASVEWVAAPSVGEGVTVMVRGSYGATAGSSGSGGSARGAYPATSFVPPTLSSSANTSSSLASGHGSPTTTSVQATAAETAPATPATRTGSLQAAESTTHATAWRVSSRPIEHDEPVPPLIHTTTHSSTASTPAAPTAARVPTTTNSTHLATTPPRSPSRTLQGTPTASPAFKIGLPNSEPASFSDQGSQDGGGGGENDNGDKAEWEAEEERRRKENAEWTGPRDLRGKPLRGYFCQRRHKTNENYGVNRNEHITSHLQVLVDDLEFSMDPKDEFKRRSYEGVIKALKRVPEITSVHEFEKLVVGWRRGKVYPSENMKARVREILNTNTLRQADARRERNAAPDSRVAVVKLLEGVYGIGRATAEKYFDSGVRTLEDLAARNLTENQRMGLRYYDDLQLRIPRDEVTEIGERVRAAAVEAYPGTEATVCGSYRRGKPDCGDVDVLLWNRRWPEELGSGVLASVLGRLQQSGMMLETLSISEEDSTHKKYMGICRLSDQHIARRLDLIFVPYRERACALLYFTGSDHFNRSMRSLAKRMGYQLSQHEIRPRKTTWIRRTTDYEPPKERGRWRKPPSNKRFVEESTFGKPLTVYTEHDVFAALKLEYFPPEERG